MKIWFDNEGTAFGGRKYFAVVEEFLVDKDGNLLSPPEVTAPEIKAEQVNENAELIAMVNDVITDVNEYSEKIKREERVEKTETVESVEKVETVEKIETVEKTENIEKTESVEKVEQVEKTETVETIENIEKAEAVEEVAEAAEEATAQSEEQPEEVAEQLEEQSAEQAASEPEQANDDLESEVAAAYVGDETGEEIGAYSDSNGDITSINVAVIGAEGQSEEPAQTETGAAVAVVAATASGAAKQSGEKTPVRSRNFAEKMRDADEVMQDRYDELKNYALRFRKLKARISKKFDSINAGRFQFVKLSIAGKTLKLYLNMDITTTDPKYHCKDMSDKKTYVTVPVLLRIKSGRAVKYAKRLIDQCAEQHGMLERRKPFVVDSMALIEEALKAREGKNAEELDDELNDDLVAATEESLSDSEE